MTAYQQMNFFQGFFLIWMAAIIFSITVTKCGVSNVQSIAVEDCDSCKTAIKDTGFSDPKPPIFKVNNE